MSCEQKFETCEFCGTNVSYPQNWHDIFIYISENNINLNSIESILLHSLTMDGMGYCKKCNLGENVNTCRIYYHITNYSKFIFILFDFNEYNKLLEKFFEIKKLSKLSLKFTDNINYNLVWVVITPYSDHFCFYINNLNMKNIPNNLNNNENYYYDNLDNSSYFIKIDSFEALLNNSYENYIPYILIYEKIWIYRLMNL